MHRIAAGRLERGEHAHDAFVRLAKEPLREFLAQVRAADEAACISLCLWGETASNYRRHTLTPAMRYVFATGDGSVRLTAIYSTVRFDTRPRTADVYAIHGRGLTLINELSTARWWFGGGELHLRMDIGPAVSSAAGPSGDAHA